MSQRTVFLARLIGLFLIALAVSMAVNRAATLAVVAAIMHDPALLWTWGMITLALGLALVLSHNLWSGVAAVLVSLFGWAALLKGLTIMVLPPAMLGAFYAAVPFDGFYLGYVGVIFALGVVLAFVGFRAKPTAA